MKINSVLKPKHMVWASGAVLAVILLIAMTGSGAKASVQAPPPPIVEVATVEQRDVPVYGEWIGTLTGQVNADVKAQVTGYLLTRKYKESHHCPPACSSTPARRDLR
jgi:multidrug efflux pump subunit AcrA (membrane-fusion protein)